MYNQGDHGAANSGSYPEVAARAVRDASQQSPSPVYGYFRSTADGITHQRIYLFNTLEEARGWFMGLVNSTAQPYDYVSVFVATDLSRPVPSLESFGHTMVGGDLQVGNALPFLLGLPLGALGGYFYRGWRDQHPGQWIPGFPREGGVAPQVGDSWGYANEMSEGGPYVGGGPWLDLVGPQVGYLPDSGLVGPHAGYLPDSGPYVGGGSWLDLVGPQVGGPWLDLVGPQVGGPYVGGGPWLDLVGPQVGADMRDQRRAWQQTRGLIESAKRDVLDAQARTPAAAWVWSFDASDTPPGSRVTELFGTQVTPFSSVEQAQAYMYDRLQMPHIALALFDTFATRHWPNPVQWNKSDDPSYEPLIAQRIAEYASTRLADGHSGRRSTTVGSAIDDVRDRALALANKRAGNVVGVIHITKENLWHALAFADEDAADEWLETLDPTSFTYAAYFDKLDRTWPNGPVLQRIGGFRASSRLKASMGASIGAAGDDGRVFSTPSAYSQALAHAKALATGTQGNAVGVVNRVDGSWSTAPFNSLNDAIDWLSRWTRNPTSFSYAAVFDKDADGTAFVQQEEYGVRPAAWGQQSLAKTSGGYTWRAA